jgi:hypothetical protein
MANHLRQQIREAVATAITGLPTSGARVFQARAYPLERADLPGLLVTTSTEATETISLGPPRSQIRTLRVQITALARATSNVDDTLDTMAKEIETALAMPCAALAGLVKNISLTDTATELAGTGDRPLARSVLTFDAVYMTAENAPDLAL